MPKMTLHIINARHQLTGIAKWLSERLDDAFVVSAKHLPLLDTDVIMRAGKAVIPEKGHLGYAPERGLIYVTVDPENPILRTNPSQSLERMLAHELHHSSRWDGPGYGKTLGEALVSEGLAGHFAQEVYGGACDPWEQLPASTLRPYFFKAQADWQSADYNHAEWFFGSQEFPAWVGYSLGYEMVGRYLAAHGDARASNLVHADAADFRAFLDAV
ncbi:DUF2268 domain-containing putative Zn-dependent protease [Paenirhodobacter populi]|uniref:Peptidase n=1 Tax=Paenirhodobacter populi TaxID=2306993 RepID=A0A443J9V1_9RHOB|nr:DUF2268 domain-containing putative Zn-dependent protease [Sinirhodobacter populi]RWR17301.1 peptidase [Sinirhodobacter populi]